MTIFDVSYGFMMKFIPRLTSELSSQRSILVYFAPGGNNYVSKAKLANITYQILLFPS